jgi:hypothetical protein
LQHADVFPYLLPHVYRSYDACVLLCSVLSGGKKTRIKPNFIMQLQMTVDYKHDTLIFEQGVRMYTCA